MPYIALAVQLSPSTSDSELDDRDKKGDRIPTLPVSPSGVSVRVILLREAKVDAKG
jgi:hypothetical protein